MTHKYAFSIFDEQYIEVSWTPGKIMPVAYASQGDTDRCIYLTFDDARPMMPSTQSMIVVGTRPDGKKVMYECTLDSGGKSTAFYADENFTKHAGDVYCELVVGQYDDETETFSTRTGSGNFILRVEAAGEEQISFYGGIGDLPITENGDYDVREFSSVSVDIESDGGAADLVALIDDSTRVSSVSLDLSGTHIGVVAIQAFYGLKALGEVTLDAEEILYQAFRGSGVVKATLKGVGSIDAECFKNSYIEELHITDVSAVPVMSNSNALSGTPIALGSGVIYFPTTALANAAKQATNWATYASVIQAES